MKNDFDYLVDQIKRSGKKASTWMSEQKFEDQKKFVKMLWSRGNLFELFRKVSVLKKIN